MAKHREDDYKYEYVPPTYREIYEAFAHPEYTVGEETKIGVHEGDTAIVLLEWAGIRTDWVEKVNENGTLNLSNSPKVTLPIGSKVKIRCPHGIRGL